MHGRVRVAPSPVPHPDLDVLRAATLQLAEWSGLVGHLHELRRRGRDVPPLRNTGGYLIYRIGDRPEIVAEGIFPLKQLTL